MSNLTIQESIDIFSVLFTHIFRDEREITTALARDGINDIAEFINQEPAEFQHFESENNKRLSRKVLRMIKNIQRWAKHLVLNRNNIEISNITMQDYINFKMELATTISMTDDQSVQSTITEIFMPSPKPEKTSQAPTTMNITPITKLSVSFADTATQGSIKQDPHIPTQTTKLQGQNVTPYQPKPTIVQLPPLTSSTKIDNRKPPPTPSTPGVTQSPQVQQVPVSVVQPMPMNQPVVHSQETPNMFLTNVKLDIKSFPTFDGKKEHWLKFKWGVLSIGYTHGLDAVFRKC